MKYEKVMLIIVMTVVMSVAGCGKASKSAEEEEPAPVSTEAPATPAPSPAPSPEPAAAEPANTSPYVYLTNETGGEIREIYLRPSGTEAWGSNLLPAGSSIGVAQQMQMYYSTGTSVYDIRLVDGAGIAYEIGNVNFDDMEIAQIKVKGGIAYLSYMSLSQNKQMTTSSNTNPAPTGNSGATAVQGNTTTPKETYVIVNMPNNQNQDSGNGGTDNQTPAQPTPIPDQSISEIPDPPDPEPTITEEPVSPDPEPTITEEPVPPDPEPTITEEPVSPDPEPTITEEPDYPPLPDDDEIDVME